ncbi:MAG: SDR family NAD(P)-dependent oxidoreductase [Myxococcota bacterium]|nr:SDR family NAD(P)-dependent oxidoreductase [Myxococcota bacterium]
MRPARLESFRGVRTFLTGASSGIGRALALRMGRDGARVALVARREKELLALAEEIRAAGGEALALPCDVAEREACEEACARAEAWLGGVDLLVNNAGYGRHRRLADHDVADIERLMRVNYLGAVYCIKALLPGMLERRRGWIVFMASVAGKIASPDESAYAASKFALVGLASALSLEVEDAGVHVLTVCPGVIRTPFFDDEALSRMPPVALGQMVEPETLVEAVVRALARGRHEVTHPRAIGVGYVVQALAPGFMRRQVRRATIDAVARRDAQLKRS